MASFERSSSGAVLASFEDEEASILRRLLDEMTMLLKSESDDPITHRLFPRAYESDDDQTAYAELIGDQLERTKLQTLEKVSASLPADEESVNLDPELLEAWLVVLTDIRVALGTRLEVTEEVMSAELDPDDPQAPALSVLHWLGWVQESLLRMERPE